MDAFSVALVEALLIAILVGIILVMIAERNGEL